MSSAFIQLILQVSDVLQIESSRRREGFAGLNGLMSLYWREGEGPTLWKQANQVKRDYNRIFVPFREFANGKINFLLMVLSTRILTKLATSKS